MLYVYIVSLVCLGILALEAIAVVATLVFSSRAERVEFFRGFKRGKFALIFIIAIPLYYIGHVYAKNGYVESFFMAINKIVNLVVLKYDTSSIHALLEESRTYSFAIYATFAFVACNAMFFVISLTGQYLWEYWQRVKIYVTRSDKLIIYGHGESSRKLYESDGGKRCRLILGDIQKDEAYELYIDNVAYVSSSAPEAVLEKYVKRACFFKKKLIIVVNTESEERNMLCCKELAGLLSKMTDASREKVLPRVQIYVMGDPEYQSIYEDIIDSGYGCLRYVNKYQRIAADWIEKYPLAKFMTEEHVDRSTALVRDGVDINVCLIGFGRVNREIFLTSVANNQFIKAGRGGDPEIKRVRYHIFDKYDAQNDKNLNHSYYRFKHECASLPGKIYLDAPDIPADEKFYSRDINDAKFYDELRGICKKDSRDVNFLVISYGNDLENIDLAQKLIEKRREWNLSNLYIFVRASNFKQEDTLVDDEGSYFFGYETESVYSVDRVISDDIHKMAMLRNAAYAAEHDGAVGDDAEKIISAARKKSENDWYCDKNQTQRDSSIFSCLSIRSKLNLIGLDYAPKSDKRYAAISYTDYMNVYAALDMPEVSGADLSGRPRIKYTLDFPHSLRRNLAVHEHLRWNSFMISRGFVPSTRDQILTETAKDKRTGRVKYTNGKSFTARRHGNLTTFDGLVEFRRMIAERDGCGEENTDVIKYDYQLLDEVYWLLDATGYKLVSLSDDVKERFAGERDGYGSK